MTIGIGVNIRYYIILDIRVGIWIMVGDEFRNRIKIKVRIMSWG